MLAIAHAAIGSRNLAVRYSTEASAHSCASLFATDQILFQAERLIYEQNFVEALMALEKLADYGEEEDSAFSTLVHRVVLLERLGEFRRAAELRTRIEAARTTARGDDWTAAASQERGAAFSESAEEAVEEPPPQKAKANRKAKQHPDIEPGQTPDYSQPTRDNEGPIRQ